jgi:hypothetical protein
METRSALDNAIAFLTASLAAGPVGALQVLSNAREQGIAERTMRRAKDTLGIEVKRLGEKGRKGGGSFTWQLKDFDSQESVEVGNQDNAEYADPPTKPCNCGSIDFWKIPDGRWHCAKCFPKPYYQLLHLWTVRGTND